jgi:hypothetical protein
MFSDGSDFDFPCKANSLTVTVTDKREKGKISASRHFNVLSYVVPFDIMNCLIIRILNIKEVDILILAENYPWFFIDFCGQKNVTLNYKSVVFLPINMKDIRIKNADTISVVTETSYIPFRFESIPTVVLDTQMNSQNVLTVAFFSLRTSDTKVILAKDNMLCIVENLYVIGKTLYSYFLNGRTAILITINKITLFQTGKITNSKINEVLIKDCSLQVVDCDLGNAVFYINYKESTEIPLSFDQASLTIPRERNIPNAISITISSNAESIPLVKAGSHKVANLILPRIVLGVKSSGNYVFVVEGQIIVGKRVADEDKSKIPTLTIVAIVFVSVTVIIVIVVAIMFAYFLRKRKRTDNLSALTESLLI